MRKKKAKVDPFLLRSGALALAFLMVATLLGFRLAQLQIEEHDKYRQAATLQQLSNSTIEPERGTIYDSNGNILAQSITVWTVEAAPDVLATTKLPAGTSGTAAEVASRELAELLGLDEERLLANLGDADSRYYEIIKRIEKPLADEVRALIAEYNLKGIYLIQDTKRYYPYGDLAASVLGFVSDDGGAEGLENYYEEILSGTPGRNITVVNANGGEMPDGGDGITYDAENGKSLVTTINAEIQAVVEKYLKQAVEYYSVQERATAIVMDVNTFEVLAMATYPAFDPNEPYVIYDEATRTEWEDMPNGSDEERAARSSFQGAARILQWRNKAVADTYEPGSVMKIITAAAALDSGMYTVHSPFYCSSLIHVNGLTDPMRCANNTAHGQLTLAEALIESCNVSFIQMGWGLGADTWYDYINAFGMTERTGIDLPGEPPQWAIDNLVYAPERMNDAELASVSFGQSNKYTPLQMITAVSAAVNGGYLGQPHIVKEILDADGNVEETFETQIKRQVISSETSAQLREVMEQLVSSTSSSGNHAYVAGYRVAGKSGTAQKLDKLDEYGNVSTTAFVSSFLGFAPADDPEIAVLFIMDEAVDRDYPNKPNWFGSRLAGPYVGNIIAETMPILGIEPSYSGDEELLRSTVTVPSLAGKTASNAQMTLNQSGLTYQVVGNGDSVVAQYPAASGQIPYGGQVILYTESADLQYEVVPDLTGQNPNVARDTLKGLGFNVLTTGAPDGGDSVEISAQDVEPGTQLPKGSTVELTVVSTVAGGDL